MSSMSPARLHVKIRVIIECVRQRVRSSCFDRYSSTGFVRLIVIRGQLDDQLNYMYLSIIPSNCFSTLIPNGSSYIVTTVCVQETRMPNLLVIPIWVNDSSGRSHAAGVGVAAMSIETEKWNTYDHTTSISPAVSKEHQCLISGM
jgi:hypothetical protein